MALLNDLNIQCYILNVITDFSLIQETLTWHQINILCVYTLLRYDGITVGLDYVDDKARITGIPHRMAGQAGKRITANCE